MGVAEVLRIRRGRQSSARDVYFGGGSLMTCVPDHSSTRSVSTVRFGTPIAEELPDVAHFAHHIHVQFRCDQLVSVRASPARRTAPSDRRSSSIRRTPRCSTDASTPTRLIAPMKYAFATACGRLLELPQILRQSGDRRGRIEDDFRAVEAKRARALRKVPVVADIDADRRVLVSEHRIARDCLA